MKTTFHVLGLIGRFGCLTFALAWYGCATGMDGGQAFNEDQAADTVTPPGTPKPATDKDKLDYVKRDLPLCPEVIGDVDNRMVDGVVGRKFSVTRDKDAKPTDVKTSETEQVQVVRDGSAVGFADFCELYSKASGTVKDLTFFSKDKFSGYVRFDYDLDGKPCSGSKGDSEIAIFSSLLARSRRVKPDGSDVEMSPFVRTDDDAVSCYGTKKPLAQRFIKTDYPWSGSFGSSNPYASISEAATDSRKTDGTGWSREALMHEEIATFIKEYRVSRNGGGTNELSSDKKELLKSLWYDNGYLPPSLACVTANIDKAFASTSLRLSSVTENKMKNDDRVAGICTVMDCIVGQPESSRLDYLNSNSRFVSLDPKLTSSNVYGRINNFTTSVKARNASLLADINAVKDSQIHAPEADSTLQQAFVAAKDALTKLSTDEVFTSTGGLLTAPSFGAANYTTLTQSFVFDACIKQMLAKDDGNGNMVAVDDIESLKLSEIQSREETLLSLVQDLRSSLRDTQERALIVEDFKLVQDDALKTAQSNGELKTFVQDGLNKLNSGDFTVRFQNKDYTGEGSGYTDLAAAVVAVAESKGDTSRRDRARQIQAALFTPAVAAVAASGSTPRQDAKPEAGVNVKRSEVSNTLQKNGDDSVSLLRAAAMLQNDVLGVIQTQVLTADANSLVGLAKYFDTTAGVVGGSNTGSTGNSGAGNNNAAATGGASTAEVNALQKKLDEYKTEQDKLKAEQEKLTTKLAQVESNNTQTTADAKKAADDAKARLAEVEAQKTAIEAQKKAVDDALAQARASEAAAQANADRAKAEADRAAKTPTQAAQQSGGGCSVGQSTGSQAYSFLWMLLCLLGVTVFFRRLQRV